jgi:hypothetical protein
MTPKLRNAVIKQLGCDDETELKDTLSCVENHGADSGYVGFTYYSDTVAFARRNKADILASMGEDVEMFGMSTVAELMATFKCVNGLSALEIERALIGRNSEDETTVFNALAWYALESVAREYEDS